jgi:hypothetical protein
LNGLKDLREQLTRFTDERSTRLVLLLARAFPNEHDGCIEAALADDYVGPTLSKLASCAFLNSFRQDLHQFLSRQD